MRFPPAGRILRETWKGYNKHHLSDLAAMLTYYVLFAVFPFVLFLVTLTLLVLPADTLEQGFTLIAIALPKAVRLMAMEQLHRLTDNAGSGFAVVGAALAIWGASRGAVALQTVLDQIHEVKETRPWWKVQVVAILTTLGVAILLVVALALLVIGPVVGHFIMDRLRLGTAFDIAWTIGRWLGAAVLIMLVWACLYYFLPNVKRKFRWVTPGAVVGVAIWLLASRGFMLYAEHFGSYDKTYGTLGAVIVFLTWIWLSCMALLIGGQVDDAIDSWRKEIQGQTHNIPKEPATAESPKREPKIMEEKPVKDTRLAPISRDQGLSDMVRRVGDDLSTLAKSHLELARTELTATFREKAAETASWALLTFVGLIGLAMLCITAVVAAEPAISLLWLRLLIGTVLYIGIGAALVMILRKQVQHG